MDDFEWTAATESKLFEAMIGYKPVGINKYFEMACIWEKLQENNIEINSEKIWAHLDTMYNLESLDEIEILPFPNEEREFYLPELEFGALKVKKEEKPEEKNGKSTTKRTEHKDTTKTSNTNTKEVKKEEKTTGKKETPRRDSKDGKEAKLTVILKKEVKKEVTEKPKPMKSRSSVNLKEEEKSRTPSRTDEALKRLNKRPTRGSTKPEDPLTPVTRKSQSPLTVNTPASSAKRRRL